MTDINKPTEQEAKKAVETLIRWAGDDPNREGLLETPKRVIHAFNEFFAGYQQDPRDILAKTFEEVADYDEIVLVKNIRLESYCEHHMAPIVGTAHIGYLPNQCVVGISKLARVVDLYAKRLQIQEKLTSQIASAIQDVLQPKGVAVVIDACHHCMSTRGVHKESSSTVTSKMLGLFRDDPRARAEFLSLIKL